MENQKSKSFNYYMRSLHRDIGFFHYWYHSYLFVEWYCDDIQRY